MGVCTVGWGEWGEWDAMGVEAPQRFGAKSDHADIASMWWLATGHSGATLDVISILNVTLGKPITIYLLVSPGPHSPFNLTVI